VVTPNHKILFFPALLAPALLASHKIILLLLQKKKKKKKKKEDRGHLDFYLYTTVRCHGNT
jgi:hypothetical protein